MSEEECTVCKYWDHPCEECRKAIHQSWHAAGLWWIRSEECDADCQEHISRKPLVSEVE